MLAQVRKLSSGRLKKAKDYLKMFPEREFWETVIANMNTSRFLTGQIEHNGRRFTADIDWLLSKGKDGTENCVKVYEGKYNESVIEQAITKHGLTAVESALDPNSLEKRLERARERRRDTAVP